MSGPWDRLYFAPGPSVEGPWPCQPSSLASKAAWLSISSKKGFGLGARRMSRAGAAGGEDLAGPVEVLDDEGGEEDGHDPGEEDPVEDPCAADGEDEGQCGHALSAGDDHRRGELRQVSGGEEVEDVRSEEGPHRPADVGEGGGGLEPPRQDEAGDGGEGG